MDAAQPVRQVDEFVPIPGVNPDRSRPPPDFEFNEHDPQHQDYLRRLVCTFRFSNLELSHHLEVGCVISCFCLLVTS